MQISALNSSSLPQWQLQEAKNRFSAVVKASGQRLRAGGDGAWRASCRNPFPASL
jgi:hypothetical protein